MDMLVRKLLRIIQLFLTEILAAITRSEAKQDEILQTIKKGGENMKKDFDVLRAEMEASTTKIGQRLQTLIDKVAAGGMSEQEETATLAEFRTLADALNQMGKDPENPVPPVPDLP